MWAARALSFTGSVRGSTTACRVLQHHHIAALHLASFCGLIDTSRTSANRAVYVHLVVNLEGKESAQT